jgi:hypothetical protein
MLGIVLLIVIGTLNFHPVDQMVANHDAVVIGLMGLDTEHGAPSELHPVHAIAIRENARGAIDPANDSWAIFVRNWGNKGERGSQQHYLDAGTITLDLPRPGNVASNAVVLPTGTTPSWRTARLGLQVLTTLDTGELAWNAGLCLAANVAYGTLTTEIQTFERHHHQPHCGPDPHRRRAVPDRELHHHAGFDVPAPVAVSPAAVWHPSSRVGRRVPDRLVSGHDRGVVAVHCRVRASGLMPVAGVVALG